MKSSLNLKTDHEFKLGIHTIKVKFVAPDHEYLKGDHGCYQPQEYTIYINKVDPDTIKYSTYLHESIHVFEHIYTFSLNHTVLNLIAECLTQVLLQDKKCNK